MHPAAQDEATLLRDCTFGKGRGSGPGGQHRNKVETLVWVVHRPTGIEAHAGERRSAVENQRMAVRRLRLLLACQVRTSVPMGDTRSALWRSRCTPQGRIVVNPDHADFPPLLAEALDMIAACRLDPRKAGLRLCCSPSQLIKLLKDHPAAFEQVNRDRVEAGLHPLK